MDGVNKMLKVILSPKSLHGKLIEEKENMYDIGNITSMSKIVIYYIFFIVGENMWFEA